MTSYHGFDDRRIQHLGLVQGVVNRLANSSFLVKGWAVTVAGAFIGLAVSSKRWELAVVSFLPISTFWGLDAYFLRCERLFRLLYERVRQEDEDVEPFYMAATSAVFVDFARDRVPVRSTSWPGALTSVTLISFYGTLEGAAAIATIVLRSVD